MVLELQEIESARILETLKTSFCESSVSKDKDARVIEMLENFLNHVYAKISEAAETSWIGLSGDDILT